MGIKKEDYRNKSKLTEEQIKELNSYPNYWRSTLKAAAEKGESIKEVYEKYKLMENCM